jgi:hypothetical protein
MADISSFVKLSPKEAVLDTWEVVDDKGTPTAGEIVMGLVVLVAGYFFLRFAVGFFLDRLELWQLGTGFSGLVLSALELGIPAFALWWLLFTRPRLQGHLCLTNWRFVYYAQGHNRFRAWHYVAAADLDDVLGIHTFYTQGVFGTKTLQIVVHTRFREEFNITAGLSGSVFAKIPLIGKLFIRNTLGKDAFEMLPVLFARVRQHTGAAVGSSLTY